MNLIGDIIRSFLTALLDREGLVRIDDDLYWSRNDGVLVRLTITRECPAVPLWWSPT